MIISIQRNSHTPIYIVEWRANDGYFRERTFESYSAAERFAHQTECRLLIEAVIESRDATKH